MKDLQLGLHEHIESSNLKLHPGGMIYVAYEWTWLDIESEVKETQGDELEHAAACVSLNESEEINFEEDSENSEINVTHAVTFKCIGANRDHNHQVTLQIAADVMKNGEDVPVRIKPEPDNHKDSMAVAFECCVDGKWKRVGYVVKELLSEVHEALRDKCIISVSIAWIKFLLCWSRCGPGFYAGIKITKQGNWSNNVVRCASTK